MNTQERDGNGNMNASGRPGQGDRGAAPKSSGSQAKKQPKKSSGKSFSKAIEKRRFEVGGIVIIVVAVLLLIAIFAYSPADDATIENLTIFDLFSEQGRIAASRLINPLGLIGAKLSGFLMRDILGYPTALIIGVLAYWGWAMFRDEGFERASYATIYAILFSVLTAGIFGLTGFNFSELMSGAIGRLIAAMLRTVIGDFGAWVTLIVLLFITVVLLIDLDVRKTIDRIAFLFRDNATNATVRFKEWHAARRERRLREKAEREAEEAAEAEKEVADTGPEPPIKSERKPLPQIKPDVPAVQQPVFQQPIKPERPEERTCYIEKPAEKTIQLPETPAPKPENFVRETPTLPEKIVPPIQERKPEQTPSEQPKAPSKPPVTEEAPRRIELAPEKPVTPPVRDEKKQEVDYTKLSDEETIDELVAPYFKKRAGEDALENAPKEAVPAPKPEPGIMLKETVREATADLDDRNLKVQTRAHVPYQFPSVDLLTEPDDDYDSVSFDELEENKRKLLEKLRIYKIEVVKIEATVGPRVTLFELELAPDVKVSRIVALEDDLAMAMAARGIRIIAPIPGKNAVGVEIPNSKPKTVRIKSVLQSEKFKNSRFTLPIAFGKTISNETFIDDLAKMPHLLIAGSTGSGKSVGINTVLASLIYFCSPDKVKFLLIDPKRVELFPYQKLKNHFLVKYKDLEEQIITDTSKAVYALKSVEKEMEQRYERLAKAGVRNIQAFNEKFPDEEMPFIVVVIDELADMMITAGRDVEEPIARLAQLARAVGIHLVVATQRPSVDVITGVIKANFPARISYQVASKVDSRTILDSVGADQLLGNGDMLYQPASEPKPIRIQNAFISTSEVEMLTNFIYSQKGFMCAYELPVPDVKLSAGRNGGLDSDDDTADDVDKMFEEAARLVVRHQQGSVSLLQRRLKLGFSRASRIMDQLETHGIVGPPDGSKPREVLVETEDSLDLLLNNLDL